jgi:hypothetical protein
VKVPTDLITYELSEIIKCEADGSILDRVSLSLSIILHNLHNGKVEAAGTLRRISLLYCKENNKINRDSLCTIHVYIGRAHEVEK